MVVGNFPSSFGNSLHEYCPQFRRGLISYCFVLSFWLLGCLVAWFDKAKKLDIPVFLSAEIELREQNTFEGDPRIRLALENMLTSLLTKLVEDHCQERSIGRSEESLENISMSRNLDSVQES